MNRINTLAVAALFGLATVLGAVAATRTAGIGTHAHARSSSFVVAQTRRLNHLERALHRSLRQRPPALPAVPKVPAVAPRPSVQAAPQIVYRRPAPIVVVKHTSHHDDGGEAQAEGGDGGGD
jgi:hypothetical protein